MKKLTKTNFKTFIKKNAGKMFIMTRSSFRGMTDGVEPEGCPEFKPLKILLNSSEYTYGLDGVWLVGGGRDYFEAYEKDAQGYEGISVSNCCGHFIVAIKNEPEPEPEPEKILKYLRFDKQENSYEEPTDAYFCDKELIEDATRFYHEHSMQSNFGVVTTTKYLRLKD